MSEQPRIPDPSEDDPERPPESTQPASYDWLTEKPLGANPPVGLEDHELPTRRITPVEAGATDADMEGYAIRPVTYGPYEEDDLGQTRVSSTVPPEPPPDDDPLGDWYAVRERPFVPASDLPARSYRDTDPANAIVQEPPPPIYGAPGSGWASDEAAPPPPPRRRRRTARERRDSGLYLPWWSLLVLLLIVGGIAAVAILGLSLLGGQFAPGGETPVVIVVTSTPTNRPTNTLSPTRPLEFSSPTPVSGAGAVLAGATQTAAFTPPPTPSATEPVTIAVGGTVEVFDVGRAGLNIRKGPGTGFAVLFIAPEGGRFLVTDGPTPAGEFTWWQIRNPEVPAQEGWAVESFLRPVP